MHFSKTTYLAIIISLSVHAIVLAFLNFSDYLPPAEDKPPEMVMIDMSAIELLPDEVIERLPGENEEIANLTSNANAERSSERTSYSQRSESNLEQSINDELRALEQEVLDELHADDPSEETEADEVMEPQDKLEDYDWYKEQDKSYAGKVMVSYILEGRNDKKLHNPGYKCRASGQVTIDIEVSAEGEVVKVGVNAGKTTTSNACLLDEALKSASVSMFDRSSAKRKGGTITYLFIKQ